MKRVVSPLEVGKNEIKGWADRVISEEPYIKLVTNPIYVNNRWEAIAQVNGMLCRVEVTVSLEEVL